MTKVRGMVYGGFGSHWVGCDICKTLLDLLNESSKESAIELSAELFQVVSEPAAILLGVIDEARQILKEALETK